MSTLATVPTEDVLGSIVPEAEPSEGAELELEGQEPAEGAESEGGEPGAGEHEGAQPQTRTVKGVDPEVGQYLEKLKTENPKLAGKVKSAIYGGIAARKELDKLTTAGFENGVASVLELKQAFDDQLGGLDNLEELGQDVRLYKELDSKIEAGDATVIDNLAEMWPDAISVLAPKIFDKLADVAPETYNKLYSGMVVQELRAQNVPQWIYSLQGDLQRAAEMLQKPETATYAASFIERCLQGVANFQGYLKTLGQAAAAQVKEPTTGKPNGKGDEREAQYAQREAGIFQSEVKAEYQPFLSQTIKTNIDKILAAKKRTLEPEQYRDFASLVINKLSQKMHSDANYAKTVARFEQARDKAGLLKFLKSRVTAALNGENGQPGLVSKQYAIWFKGASLGSQKKDEKIDPKTGKPAAEKPGTGWFKITSAEKTQLMSQHKIDWKKTTAAMRMKNRYVLLDGRQVYHE